MPLAYLSELVPICSPISGLCDEIGTGNGVTRRLLRTQPCELRECLPVPWMRLSPTRTNGGGVALSYAQG